MHATEAQTADGFFRMDSNSSPSLEIQTGFPRVEGGGICKWKSQDTQGVCYANGTRLNGSNVSHGHTGTNRDALSGLTSIRCVTS